MHSTWVHHFYLETAVKHWRDWSLGQGLRDLRLLAGFSCTRPAERTPLSGGYLTRQSRRAELCPPENPSQRPGALDEFSAERLRCPQYHFVPDDAGVWWGDHLTEEKNEKNLSNLWCFVKNSRHQELNLGKGEERRKVKCLVFKSIKKVLVFQFVFYLIKPLGPLRHCGVGGPVNCWRCPVGLTGANTMCRVQGKLPSSGKMTAAS